MLKLSTLVLFAAGLVQAQVTNPPPIQVAGPQHSSLDTTITQAQSNAFYAVTNLVNQMNASKTQDYLTQWNSWAANYRLGSATLAQKPVVPAAFVVAYFVDPTTGPGGVGPYGTTPVQWPYPSQTGGPVTQAPADPPAPPVPGIAPPSWFSALGGTVINCPVGDTAPVGAQVVDPSGKVWVKQNSITPFGTACFYVQK